MYDEPSVYPADWRIESEIQDILDVGAYHEHKDSLQNAVAAYLRDLVIQKHEDDALADELALNVFTNFGGWVWDHLGSHDLYAEVEHLVGLSGMAQIKQYDAASSDQLLNLGRTTEQPAEPAQTDVSTSHEQGKDDSNLADELALTTNERAAVRAFCQRFNQPESAYYEWLCHLLPHLSAIPHPDWFRSPATSTGMLNAPWQYAYITPSGRVVITPEGSYLDGNLRPTISELMNGLPNLDTHAFDFDDGQDDSGDVDDADGVIAWFCRKLDQPESVYREWVDGDFINTTPFSVQDDADKSFRSHHPWIVPGMMKNTNLYTWHLPSGTKVIVPFFPPDEYSNPPKELSPAEKVMDMFKEDQS